MTTPNTQDWSAKETTDLAGGDRKLTVEGDFEVSNTNQTPIISDADSPSINPRILKLELSIRTSGTGNTVMTWKKAKYHRAIAEDQYETVEIHHDGTLVETIEVEKILS